MRGREAGPGDIGEAVFNENEKGYKVLEIPLWWDTINTRHTIVL